MAGVPMMPAMHAGASGCPSAALPLCAKQSFSEWQPGRYTDEAPMQSPGFMAKGRAGGLCAQSCPQNVDTFRNTCLGRGLGGVEKFGCGGRERRDSARGPEEAMIRRDLPGR